MSDAGSPTVTGPLHADAGAARAGSENCLPPGTRLADYEIVEVLGEGGFGIVYLAFDHSLHRHVAIKEYMPSALALRGNDAGVSLRAERHQDTFRLGLKSFINEARFLAQFDHPALVKVHRYWEQNRTAYTAMQYYEGRTIKDIVARSPELVDQAWCLRVLGNILQALEMLYTMQIVHRDVSPDNIIVQANGEAVLLDFGSARQVIGDMTRGLTVILKPGYAPVEQYAGDASLEQGAYTDIYALAAVMYFAITGKAPASSIARMIQDPLAPLATLAPAGYDSEFLAAIDKGLAVLAQDRPQSIDEFRSLLGISAASLPTPAPRASAPLRTPLAGLDNGAESHAALASAARMPVQSGTATAVSAPSAPAPVTAPAAAATVTASGAAALADSAPRRRWPPLAAAAVVLLAAAWGIASMLRDGAEDTIMLAQQQPRAAQPAASAPGEAELTEPATPPATAADTASSLDARETVVAPAASTGAASPPAAPVPAPAVTAVTAAPLPDTTTVNFSIKPWGSVTIDGRERGVSPPLKRLTLPVGRHQVRISNPGFADHRLIIDLVKGKSATVEHDFASGK